MRLDSVVLSGLLIVWGAITVIIFSCQSDPVRDPECRCPDDALIAVSVGVTASHSSASSSSISSSSAGSGGADSGAPLCSCDDGDDCTDDSIDAVGHCHHVWRAACGANPCDDGDDCSEDAPWFSGPAPAQPICCRHDYICSEQRTAFYCTITAPGQDLCEPGHSCDDGDPCTIDHPSGQGCAHDVRCGTPADYPCW